MQELEHTLVLVFDVGFVNICIFILNYKTDTFLGSIFINVISFLQAEIF